MTGIVIAPPTEKMSASSFEASRRGRHKARIMVREARKALSNQQKLDETTTQIVFDVSDIMSEVRTEDKPYVRQYVVDQGGTWFEEGEDSFAFGTPSHN